MQSENVMDISDRSVQAVNTLHSSSRPGRKMSVAGENREVGLSVALAPTRGSTKRGP